MLPETILLLCWGIVNGLEGRAKLFLEPGKNVIISSTRCNVQNPEPLQSQADQTVILIVDDDVMIRNVVRIILEAEGYFILTAHDGEEALHVSRRFPGTIHAVLSDVRMPKIGGLELRERILAERPGIKVLLMTGWVDAFPSGNVPVLAKPFTPAVLKDWIRQLLTSASA